MKKIRRGNDFVFAWEIERNGLPEDLSSVLEKHLYLSALGKRVELVEGVDYDITGNVVRIEVTPTIATILGTYKAEFHYILPDLGLIDEDRKCAVDVNAFVIVANTEQADNPSEFSITSDMAIAFKGDKGDSSYQTWLDAGNTGTEADYLAWIQQPATDIEQVVSSNETVRISSEETRQLNETARVEAEALRGSAETQRISNENTRKSNETVRINAETLRLSAEQERGTAEGLRVSSETSRNTAEGQRATAETARATAEGLRAAAETARVTAEQGRSDAELLRVGAESARNDAEGIRDANEIDRILAEGIRDANETARINAESDREDAEDLRDQAEVAREEAEGLRQTNTNTAIQAAGEATTAANTATGLAVEATTAANTAAGDANDAAEAANTAAGLANNAATTANTAAGLADNARLAIQDDLALKADEADLVQLAGEVNLFKEESNLKDAIQDSKIKDIESIISTMNPNQSAQLSVSGVSPLSLPKNASNGGMQVKLEGLTAENLVVNGDFRDGLIAPFSKTDGQGGESTLAINSSAPISGNYDIRFTITTPATSGGRPILRGVHGTTNIGDKIYLRFDAKILSGTPIISGIHNGAIVSSNYGGDVINGRNTRIIDVVDTIFSSGIIYFNSFSVWDMQMDNFMRINLTETFGAGNEPSKEQCDLIFSDYFEGVKSFEPTGRVRSVDKSGMNPTHLYLTAPELRSNGTVKDEIRKGSNGYELVKRVGVGSLGANGIAGGDFEGGLIGTIMSGNETSTWLINTTSTITGTQDGRLRVTTAGTNGQRPMLTISVTRASGQYRRISFDYKVNSGTPILGAINIGGGMVYPLKTLTGSGKYIYYYLATGTVVIQMLFDGRNVFDLQIDNLRDELINVVDGTSSGGSATQLSDGTILYTLATPEIIPISYGGVLNSAENGTVYHEPVIADAGVYGTNMPILMTDYPIATIEEIIKHEDGVDTYLNIATAVIAGDGLSFTHPDLASGDLVLFTYAYSKESTNGNITATFYDSNVVKIDTVTGKAYKITDVVTNGVLTRTLTEV